MKTNFSQFVNLFLGPSCAYFRECGDLEQVIAKSLFRSFFSTHYAPGEKTLFKYYRGTLVLPRKITKFYFGNLGLERNISDMMQLTNRCTSLAKLVQQQEKVNIWLATLDLPPEYSRSITSYYTQYPTSRKEVAIFLAMVLHIVIAMDSRPSD